MKLPVSKIPILNHTFYLISYLIFLSMAPIRRSNRVSKPRVYWDPTNTPPRRRPQPAFIIYTESPEDLSTQFSDNLSQLYEGVTEGLTEGLSKAPSTQLF